MAQNRIKELRKNLNLTLRELKEKLSEFDISVNESQISKWEKNIQSPRDEKIWLALSNIFNVPVSYLLGYSDYKSSLELIDKMLKFERDKPEIDFDEDIKKGKTVYYKEYLNDLGNVSESDMATIDFAGYLSALQIIYDNGTDSDRKRISNWTLNITNGYINSKFSNDDKMNSLFDELLNLLFKFLSDGYKLDGSDEIHCQNYEELLGKMSILLSNYIELKKTKHEQSWKRWAIWL